MRILMTLMFSLSLLSLSAQKLPNKIKSEEGKFKIAFPLEPTEQKKDVSGYNTVIYVCNLNGAVYLFSYSNIPAAESEANMLLHETKKGFLGSVDMEGKNEKSVKKGKIPGLYIEGESLDKNLYVRYEIYYSDGILYQIGIMQQDKLPEEKSMKKFTKSFKIMK